MSDFEVRDEAECDRLWNLLERSAQNRRLTAKTLVGAMMVARRGASGALESIGMQWIAEHPREFVMCCEPLSFFRENIAKPPVAQVLLRAELLELVPETEREELIRDLFVRYSASTSKWWEAPLAVGIGPTALAAMMLDRLRREKIDPRSRASITKSYALEFLKQHAAWQLLSDDQLLEAIAIMTRTKTAHVVFINFSWIEYVLGERGMEQEQLMPLLTAAAKAPQIMDFLVAVVREGRHRSRKRLEVIYRVKGGDVRFVQKFYDSYPLIAGELVKFYPGTARELADKIGAVEFIPVFPRRIIDG